MQVNYRLSAELYSTHHIKINVALMLLLIFMGANNVDWRKVDAVLYLMTSAIISCVNLEVHVQ